MQPEHQLGNEELYHIVTFYSCVLGNVSPYWIFFCILACFPGKTLTPFYSLVKLPCFIFALYKVPAERNALLFIEKEKL